MSQSELISLGALLLSIYSIYLSKRTQQHTREVEYTQRVGHAVLKATNLCHQLKSLATSIRLNIDDPRLSKDELKELKELLVGIEETLKKSIKNIDLLNNMAIVSRIQIEEIINQVEIIDKNAALIIASYESIWKVIKSRTPNKSPQPTALSGG